MKNKISVSEIARRMEISKSTVSKALGNKPGVDEETKNQIVRYASSVGYFSSNKKCIDIVMLLPDRYKELCSAAQKMMGEAGIEARCGVYLNAEDYVKSLKALTKLAPEIAVVYPMHIETEEALLKKAGNVWFVGDYINIENTFFFGANPANEADALANIFIESKRSVPVFIHSHKSVMNARRTEIFAKKLALSGIYHKGNIMLDGKTNLSAPIIARQLGKYCNDADSVYCGDEASELVKKALQKLGRDDMPVFEYDDKENLKKAINLIIKKAKRYIENGDYPPCKYNFV